MLTAPWELALLHLGTLALLEMWARLVPLARQVQQGPLVRPDLPERRVQPGLRAQLVLRVPLDLLVRRVPLDHKGRQGRMPNNLV